MRKLLKIIFFSAMLSAGYWVYLEVNKPTAMEMEFFERHHRKALGLSN